MRDIVYIMGKGSKWWDNELRYSLRSLEQFGRAYDKVYIVGECPEFINKKALVHVPCIDPFVNKQRNIYHKILTASRNTEISNNFILMNDDIFLLHPYVFEEVYYWPCTLEQLLINSKGNKYSLHIQATINMYANKREKCFDTHYPFIINKKGYVAANKLINWEVEKGYLTKTIYMRFMLANKFISEDKIIRHPDCLMYKPNQFIPNNDVISISTNGLGTKMKEFLRTSFPNKSKFET